MTLPHCSTDSLKADLKHTSYTTLAYYTIVRRGLRQINLVWHSFELKDEAIRDEVNIPKSTTQS